MASKLIEEKALGAARHYERCMLCEHRCGVDRAREKGKCHAGPVPRVFRNRVECADEKDINPCHLFYLSGCDLRCVFCVNEVNSFDPARGHELTPEFFRAALARGKARGARTLQWVGGEPTIHLPAILRVMAGVADLPPVVWKSDFHFTPDALDLLDGVVDVFIADYKFGNDACARRLSGIRDYTAVVQRNLRAAAGKTRLIVRHLLMPGHFECCWKPVAAWLAENLPEAEVSIRGGFMPRWRAPHFAELSRPIERGVFAAAQDTARRLQLRVVS